MDVSASRPTVAVLALLLATAWAPAPDAQRPPRPRAADPQYTQWGSVQDLEGGWGADVMSVRHSAPLVNPDGCSVTNAGHATSAADAGHSLFHTLLLSALLNRRGVSMLISGCSFNKPRVLSVKIR